jgi:hypothetical protein
MKAQLEPGDPTDSDDDVEELEPQANESQTDETIDSKRYGLCVSTSRHGKTFGVWDGTAGAVIERFCTRDEAMAALAQIVTEN